MSESSVPVPRPSEPLPCPWCDSGTGTNRAGKYWYVECLGPCDAEGPCGDSEAEAVELWNSVRRSPSVPTATQEQRDAGVADATYWRDKAKHMAALMAMAGATLCEPVSTANIRDAKKSCDIGVHVMREIIEDEKRVASSEEAANSDTDRLNALEELMRPFDPSPNEIFFAGLRRGPQTAEEFQAEIKPADGDPTSYRAASLRSAIDRMLAARVQGEN